MDESHQRIMQARDVIAEETPKIRARIQAKLDEINAVMSKKSEECVSDDVVHVRRLIAEYRTLVENSSKLGLPFFGLPTSFDANRVEERVKKNERTLKMEARRRADPRFVEFEKQARALYEEDYLALYERVFEVFCNRYDDLDVRKTIETDIGAILDNVYDDSDLYPSDIVLGFKHICDFVDELVALRERVNSV